MSTNNKTSFLVSSELPAFVRNDDPIFIEFVTAYYQFLEQSNTVVSLGGVTERTKNLLNYVDIDKTLDDFTNLLYKKFITDFPAEMLADKKVILKHAKDFYRAKGTENSYRFLMRALYDEEIEFYYPKSDILKASDGKWYIQQAIRILGTNIDGASNTDISGFEKFISHRISGNTSRASATVESTDRYYTSGAQVDELTISDIKGTFVSGENISTSFSDNGISYIVSANISGSAINSVIINNPGSGYSVGDPVIVISSKGAGACVQIAQVSAGNIASIGILSGGAGYRIGDYLLVTGGGGSGANGDISTVLADSSVHPNTYTIYDSIISLEANTPINNTVYSNLNPSINDPCNNWIQNSLSSFVYSNTGPASGVIVLNPGTGYLSIPSIGVLPNTIIAQLGILGRMKIANGGLGYGLNDVINITNITGGYGTAGQGYVSNVAANGMITGVKFQGITGHLVGGEGYDINYLPTANVINTLGSGIGANVIVTNLLGTGATFELANTTLGSIERVIIIAGGSNYTDNPTADLTGSGDGTGNVSLTAVSGLFTYPGRYLNDDGQVSSYNFLQDRDYYQNFSYVIRVKESIDKYRKTFKDLVHPAGLKMFGEYQYIDDSLTSNLTPSIADSGIIQFKQKTFIKTGN